MPGLGRAHLGCARPALGHRGRFAIAGDLNPAISLPLNKDGLNLSFRHCRHHWLCGTFGDGPTRDRSQVIIAIVIVVLGAVIIVVVGKRQIGPTPSRSVPSLSARKPGTKLDEPGGIRRSACPRTRAWRQAPACRRAPLRLCCRGNTQQAHHCNRDCELKSHALPSSKYKDGVERKRSSKAAESQVTPHPTIAALRDSCDNFFLADLQIER